MGDWSDVAVWGVAPPIPGFGVRVMDHRPGLCDGYGGATEESQRPLPVPGRSRVKGDSGENGVAHVEWDCDCVDAARTAHGGAEGS